MQRILSVYDWQRIEENMSLPIATDVPGQRQVRIRVNAPVPVQLWLQVPDCVDPIFLARVSGLDEIRFELAGDYTLIPVGGEIWVDTLDGTDAHVEPVDDTSFTRAVERMAPTELQIMERKMMENTERRMQALLGAFASVISEKDAELEAVRKTTGDASRKTGEPSDASGTSGEQAPPVSAEGTVAGGGDNDGE